MNRTIKHLGEYKDTIEEITNEKVDDLEAQIVYLRKYGDKEKDQAVMMYEDVRSQAYEYKQIIE